MATDQDRVLAELTDAAARFELRLAAEQIEVFLRCLGQAESLHRLERLGKWMKQVNAQNHDGVHLTPIITDHLTQVGDFEQLLRELDRLRDETRRGRFCFENALQRDLEFIRYSTELNWHQNSEGSSNEHYPMFQKLDKLSDPVEDPCELSPEHLVEAKRTAYEAAGFLRFLREYQIQTARGSGPGASRAIVVVGNDRYGRQWVVEPLEDHLENEGFALRYDRSPSHKSMRLKVRHELPENIRLGFPRDFVRQMNAQMPHIVIVDSCAPLEERNGMMRFSRGSRDYVNWFMVFNDLRAQGDGSKYEKDSGLEIHHFAELRKWHEYERVRRQIRHWVTPGTTYAVAHWAPYREERVFLGDFESERRDLDPNSTRPQVILANPTIYENHGDGSPKWLEDTHPYYFDGPERFASERVIFGFGSHGLETRIEGTTVDTLVAAVQSRIKAEINEFLREEMGTGTSA